MMGELPNKSYLNWDKPLLSSATEWLLSGCEDRLADLSDTLLLLPTQQAGRRLRETLAAEMAKREGGLFPPRTATPALMLARESAQNAATELACLWHWGHVLQTEKLERYPSLFPKLPAKIDFNWSRLMAQTLHRLRGTLVDAGLDCAAVAALDECVEQLRWQDLAKLETRYQNSLQQVGLIDAHDAKREASAAPELPLGVQRIVIMGVTDLTRLVQSAFGQAQQQGTNIELVIFGPPNEESLFDDWGRPIPSHWCQRELPLSNEQLHPALDEKAQAKRIAEVLGQYGRDVYESVGVGSADAKVVPQLEHELSRSGVRRFNPAGENIRRASVFAYLKSMLAVLQNPTFTNADTFLRSPDSWAWLMGKDETIEPTPLLGGLDDMREKHLPVSLSATLNLEFEKENENDNISRRIMARSALRQLHDEMRRLERGNFSDRLLSFLKATFANREFQNGDTNDSVCAEVIRLLKDRFAVLDEAVPAKAKRDAVAELTLLLDSLGRESLVAERPPGTIDLQGWLELAWEDAPHLLVAGVNEGVLPASVHGDCFLPESLRKQLGLRSNEDRFARDAWLLELLGAVRSREGRVDFFTGRQRGNGDPLKPSRLLFRCSDGELPDRVNRLFAPLPPPEQAPAWSVPWKLTCADVAPPEKLSVTGMADYLACPYRFFLKQVKRMQAMDIDQRELDPRGFGNLIHGVLDAYGRDDSMADVENPKKIEDYFTATLEELVRRNFGEHRSLPLIVQSDIAIKRLSVVAKMQAAEKQAGWKIIGAEESFNLEFDGVMVRGRIDRIEKNEETGEVRVLDYKTSSTASAPAKNHWSKFVEAKQSEWVREYARFEIGGKPFRWIGLQLPLYAMALEERFGAAISLGYFNIPEVGADVGIQLLAPCDTQLLEAARQCVEGVVADVKAGRFWPPNTKPKYDDFQSILFGEAGLTAMEPKVEVAR